MGCVQAVGARPILGPCPLAPAVREVLDLIGVEVPPGFEPPPPTIAKQADGLSEDWVRRFRERLALS